MSANPLSALLPFLLLPLIAQPTFACGETPRDPFHFEGPRQPSPAVEAELRAALRPIVAKWACPGGKGDFDVVVRLGLVTGAIVSTRYDVLMLCEGMSSPAGFTRGLTLRRPAHQVLPISSLSSLSPVALRSMVLSRAAQMLKASPDGDCPDPQFSGEFYLDGNDVVFIEFFPSHADEPCEVEVRLPRADLRPPTSQDQH